MAEVENRGAENLWQAYGPEKDAWKSAPGNCYTPKELARMEAGLKDLKISRIRKRVYVVD
jgi:hypothetical protein